MPLEGMLGKMARLFTHAATAVLATVLVGSANLGAQPPAPQELLAAMRSGSSELAALERSTRSYKCKNTLSHITGTIADNTSLVWRSGESVLVEVGKGNKRGGLNPDYFFAVERGQNGGQWALTQFAGTDRVKVFDQNLGSVRHVAFPLTTIGKDTLEERINNPKFRMNSTRVRPDGAIEADFSTEERTERGIVILTGTITVSAKQRGLVLMYQHSTSSGARPVRFTMTRELDDTVPGYQCRTLTFDLTDPKSGQLLNRQQAVFSEYDANPIDQAEFYLSHYGLPEPIGVATPAKRTPLYVWFLVAAGGFAAIAVLFRWRARRMRAASPPEVTA